MEGVILAIGVFFGLAVLFAITYGFWRIFKRAGFNPLMSLIIFIPTVGVVLVLCILAFARWPAEKDNTPLTIDLN